MVGVKQSRAKIHVQLGDRYNNHILCLDKNRSYLQYYNLQVLS